jgi:hypothetical protein
VVDVRRPGEVRPLDAMNYAPPFIPGALRGGSHVHVFSPDGAWVSNTYEDDVLARLGAATVEGGDRDFNQRNIAVSVPAPPAALAASAAAPSGPTAPAAATGTALQWAPFQPLANVKKET